MSLRTRALWCLLAVGGLLASGVPAGAAAMSAATCGSPVRQVYPHSQPTPGSLPVLFVHGMGGDPSTWTKPDNSLAAQVAAVPGVTAWTFDYSTAALNWVTDPRIGQGLATGITCLVQASGHPVLVVAHSMGGLATQDAIAQPNQQGGTVGDHVAEVITIGTPFLGSRLLSAAQAGVTQLEDTSLLGKVAIEALLSACAGHARADDADNPCGFLSIARSPVGSALEYRSPQLAALPQWPSQPPVLPMAGNIQERITVSHVSVKADIGDGLVTEDSAIAQDTAGPAVQVYCPISLIHPTQTGACYHTSLPTNPTIEASVVAAVRSQAAAIAVLPGSHAINRQIYADGDLVVTLTDVAVEDNGEIRVNIDYHNVGTTSKSLSCDGLADASSDAALTSADGTEIDATHTYCSDNPNATFELGPGQRHASYALFGSLTGQTGPFTLDWQDGAAISGTVSDLRF